MNNFEAVIGLEVHVQLNTHSKIFCRCFNRAEKDEEPNTRTCPICSGHPGTLPVINQQVIEFAVKAGLATNCKINSTNVFSRKHYFYPDLPKGFQISQYDLPVCQDGNLDIEVNDSIKQVRIRRIHLEEDAGKNTHFSDHSSIDLNRAGTPLIEIVSEPDLRSSEEASAYLRELYAIVTCLGICAGNLEDGNFRCDANVSIMPKGSTQFGTRTELKNINSFRFVEKAIEIEIVRQIEAVQSGHKIVQETRGYDSLKNITYSMRSKEEAHDYRYFPEPDLISPISFLVERIETWKKSLPELPQQKRKRFMMQYQLSAYDARVITNSKSLADFFEAAMFSAEIEFNKIIANMVMGDVARLLNEFGTLGKLTSKHLLEIAKLFKNQIISNLGLRKIIEVAWETGDSVETIIEKHDLKQVNDSDSLKQVIDKIIISNPKQVEQYKSGKVKVFAFFVGQVMKETGGKANPQLVKEILENKLK